MKKLFSLFSRSVENPAVPLSQATSDFFDPYSCHITPEKALGVPAFYRAVDLVSSKLGNCPLMVYKDVQGSKQKYKEHFAYNLIAKRPHPFYSASTWKKTTIVHCLIYGHSLSYLERDWAGKAQTALLLNPEEWAIVIKNGQLFYAKTDGTAKLLPESVLHFKGLSNNGISGVPVIQIMKESLGLAVGQQSYAKKWFESSGSTNTVIILPPNLQGAKSEEVISRLRQNWDSIHSGINNAHKISIFSNGTDIKNLGISHEDAQLLDSRKLSDQHIALICGVPLHKVSAGVNSSYSSFESENMAFLSDSLNTWLTMFEDELNYKLLTEAEKSAGEVYIEFIRESLIEMDTKTKIEVLAKQVDSTLLSPDEARAKLNLPPLPDGLGEDFRMPSNMVIVGEEPPQTPQPAPGVNTPNTANNAPVEPTDSPVDPSAARLAALVDSVVDKQLVRISKALEAQKGKDWNSFLSCDLVDKHLSPFVDSISPVAGDRSTAIAEKLFARIQEIGKAQPVANAKAVIEQLNKEQLVKEVLNGNP